MAKANASKKTDEQLRSGIKKYQKIIEQAYSRDINESDTAIIIRDFLADVLNFDRYSEITTEYSIKGTYCDLAIRQNGKISLIIEVKAIGIDLKEIHARQAIDYATKEGVDWVLLTNGITWQAYKLFFSKPVVTEMVFSVNILNSTTKIQQLVDMFFLFSKEGFQKSALTDYYRLHQATNRFAIAALLQSDPIISCVKRELCRVHKGIKIENSRIADIIRNEIIKRDIIEDERLCSETKRFSKSAVKCTGQKPSTEPDINSVANEPQEKPQPDSKNTASI